MFDEENVIYRYKYLPFTDGALKAITESTMKFTCPLEFNDPFDCNPYYNKESILNYPKNRPDLYKKTIQNLGLSPGKGVQAKRKIAASLKNSIDIGEFRRDLIKNVGIVCLSKDALNILMWSHYADFHKGMVLEFRIPIKGTKEDVSLMNERLTPFPVIYSKQRPHIMLGTEKPKDIVEKLVLTKSIHWKYEKEERVIDRNRSPGIYHYHRDEILCSVIAGMNISNTNYKKLQKIVTEASKTNSLNLLLYKAKPKNDEYKLLVNKHPRLGI